MFRIHITNQFLIRLFFVATAQSTDVKIDFTQRTESPRSDVSSNDGTEIVVQEKHPNRVPLTDVLKLFGLAVDEVTALMRTDSLTRFTSTKQYHHFYTQSANHILKQRGDDVVNVDRDQDTNDAPKAILSLRTISPSGAS